MTLPSNINAQLEPTFEAHDLDLEEFTTFMCDNLVSTPDDAEEEELEEQRLIQMLYS